AFDFTVIAIAFDKKYAGYLSISDQIKSDAKAAVERLHKMNAKTFILSGDKNEVVQKIARELGIDKAYGELLPHEKVAKVKKIKNSIGKLAFVGDGVNDAPVIALSDIGMAMGGLGSDAAIETADVVIQDDMPSRIPMAIDIGKQTKKIVWQNISLAFGIKMLVMILGAMGLASMWEAVFADVGVALLAILNAIRIQRKKF
ncbi:MAG TPA: HAD-IC family P-type ATPase, partial [Flavobacteriaceae bacterium]|nr:HAD-IC family P-type ATPase [Flavobacteriaceae bacterium]